VNANYQEAMHGAIPPEDIRVTFGPNDVHIGKEYKGDPYINETKLKISDFTFLEWMDRFPEWHLTACAQPGPPPPPGVAEIKSASMLDEGVTPDQAVTNARKEVSALSGSRVNSPLDVKILAP
jgi:hypothetical protein